MNRSAEPEGTGSLISIVGNSDSDPAEADASASDRRWSRTESVHDRVRDMILTGEIPPGTVVSQAALARELGLSRAPIREALRRLEGEGLVESRHNQRVQTADLSIADMEQIYASRIALEALAVRFTVPVLARDDIDGMREALQHMRDSAAEQDRDQWSVRHSRFHTLALARAGSRLMSLIMQLDDHANRYRALYMTQVTSSWSAILDQDAAVLDAVERTDVEEVVDRWARHLAHTALSTIAIVDPAHDARLLRAALQGVHASRGTQAGQVPDATPDSGRRTRGA